MSNKSSERNKEMKKYTGTFFRSNPQLKSGGYETERTVEAKTEKSAIKKFNDICSSGTHQRT